MVTAAHVIQLLHKREAVFSQSQTSFRVLGNKKHPSRYAHACAHVHAREFFNCRKGAERLRTGVL